MMKYLLAGQGRHFGVSMLHSCRISKLGRGSKVHQADILWFPSRKIVGSWLYHSSYIKAFGGSSRPLPRKCDASRMKFSDQTKRSLAPLFKFILHFHKTSQNDFHVHFLACSVKAMWIEALPPLNISERCSWLFAFSKLYLHA